MKRLFVFLFLIIPGAANAQSMHLCNMDIEKAEAPDGGVFDGRALSGEQLTRRVTAQTCAHYRERPGFSQGFFADDNGNSYVYTIGHPAFTELQPDPRTRKREYEVWSQKWKDAKKNAPIEIKIYRYTPDEVKAVEKEFIYFIADNMKNKTSYLDESYQRRRYEIFPWAYSFEVWDSTFRTSINGTLIIEYLRDPYHLSELEKNGFWLADRSKQFSSAAFQRHAEEVLGYNPWEKNQ